MRRLKRRRNVTLTPRPQEQPQRISSRSETEPTRKKRIYEGYEHPYQNVPPVGHAHTAPIVLHPTPPVEYRSTYRADLAKRGLLVKCSLGSGSYSKVKKAINAHANFEEVAVKIVDRLRAPKDYQEKFLPRELSIWARLRHPNLVALLDYFEDSLRVYMVLEYANGGDALKYIQKTGALSEDQSRVWINQIGDAVRYLHDQNIAHRDLKLENLLLVERGKKIKLCDFGFVKDVCKSDLSQTFCGSKAYAAPEILKGRSYDPKKGDVWAMGVILYIFVTGKMPFDETRGTQEHPRGTGAVEAAVEPIVQAIRQMPASDTPNVHLGVRESARRLHRHERPLVCRRIGPGDMTVLISSNLHKIRRRSRKTGKLSQLFSVDCLADNCCNKIIKRTKSLKHI